MSFAKQIINMRGYTKQQALIEIAATDGVSIAEAEIRYDMAIAVSSSRSKAGHTRAWVARQAREDAKKYHSGQWWAYQEIFAERWKIYRKAFFKEQERLKTHTKE